MKEEPTSLAVTPPTSPKHRVFVVDDHPLMRRSLVDAVDREPNLEVCGQAEDARHALTAVLLLKPDLVLTDIQLGITSGIDLIRAIQERLPGTITVATTMFDVRRNERLARAAGAAGFASKHDGPEKLIATVHSALQAAGK